MSRCTLCTEEGHRASKCPELRDTLRSGFAKRNGYHDEEDESISFDSCGTEVMTSASCGKMLVAPHNSQGGGHQSKLPMSVPLLHSRLSNVAV